MPSSKNNYDGQPLNPTLYPQRWGFLYFYENVIPYVAPSVLPYASGSWRWLAVPAGTGSASWLSVGFDDSTWTVNSTPFATVESYVASNQPYAAQIATRSLIPTTTPYDFFYRISLDNPNPPFRVGVSTLGTATLQPNSSLPIPDGTKLTIHGPSDDGVIVCFNGVQVWNDITASRGATYDNWSATVFSCHPNLVSVQHRNGGGAGYFDAQVDYA